MFFKDNLRPFLPVYRTHFIVVCSRMQLLLKRLEYMIKFTSPSLGVLGQEQRPFWPG